MKIAPFSVNFPQSNRFAMQRFAVTLRMKSCFATSQALRCIHRKKWRFLYRSNALIHWLLHRNVNKPSQQCKQRSVLLSSQKNTKWFWSQLNLLLQSLSAWRMTTNRLHTDQNRLRSKLLDNHTSDRILVSDGNMGEQLWLVVSINLPWTLLFITSKAWLSISF